MGTDKCEEEFENTCVEEEYFEGVCACSREVSAYESECILEVGGGGSGLQTLQSGYIG
jgi:hypothetical protein